MPDFKTLDDLDPAGKTILLRADLNVPVKEARVTDSTRLAKVAPTILELCDKGARVIILSHFGRPDGRPLPDFSLRQVIGPLEMFLGRNITFIDDCLSEDAVQAARSLKNGDVMLLENVRFYPGEEKNDPEFAKNLAALGDVFVNDAFSAAHRAHASTAGLAQILPAYAGRLMQQELESLHQLLNNPAPPVCAIVGGAKISTKLDLLNNLVARLDYLILGGGMASSFLYAQGIDMGKSLVEADMAENARNILAKADKHNCEIILPKDGVIAASLIPGADCETVSVQDSFGDKMMLDIGPHSIQAIIDVLKKSKTLVWNGPLGAFETPPFDTATVTIAKEIAKLTRAGQLLSVAGGGDTLAALNKAGVEEELSYVSTAGGAFLEWLEGKNLPGLAALKP